MHPALCSLNLRDASEVVAVFARGAEANGAASCRRASIDVIPGGAGRLIASGDLHDNPLHMARLVEAAGLGDEGREPAHLTFHEIIHPDTLINGMDFSFRALARVAALKAAHPEHVHTLLANHELAQVSGRGIVKDGVRVVDAFNEGVAYAFPDDAPDVLAAIVAFIRSMPLALRVAFDAGEHGAGADLLCAHSLPGPELIDRFDPSILEREMTEEDFVARQGSAHIMIWGRDHTPDLLDILAARWGVSCFVLGHEKADSGALFVPRRAVVLNSDHARGVYADLPLDHPVSAEEVMRRTSPLGTPS